MRAVILAAGIGRRLQSVISHQPKCLIKIGHTTLLHHQLINLERFGITDITLVVGYQKDSVKRHAKELPLNFSFVVNHQFAETNTAYSLYLALNEVEDDIIYLNADVLFHSDILHRLLKSPCRDAMAIVKKACSEEEVKVICQGHIIKQVGKQIAISECYGEFIGIAKFSKDTIAILRSQLQIFIKTNEGKNAYFEDALNMILDSVEICAVDITDLPCIEIDFPQDLKIAISEIYPAIYNSSSKHADPYS
jgi:choline kinase